MTMSQDMILQFSVMAVTLRHEDFRGPFVEKKTEQRPANTVKHTQECSKTHIPGSNLKLCPDFDLPENWAFGQLVPQI